MARALAVHGLESVCCAGEQELFTLVGCLQPRLLIIDQMLGTKRPGWEIAQAIRQQIPTIPIIIVTGVPDPDLCAAVASDPYSALLEKPFSIHRLAKTIDALCGAD